MISTVAAATLLTALVVAMAVWGSYVGIASAERGPTWAQNHLQRMGRLYGVGVLIGLAAALVVDPAWFGLAFAYVALVTWWISRRVLRAVSAAESLGAGDPLPADRVVAMLRRASNTLMVAGLVVIVIALADFVWRSWPALVDVALAAALLVPAFAYRRRADRLSSEPSPTSVI
ncbi:MAG: hypothetical protein ACE5MI_06840 [Acidimicrobiia bacterium]